MKTKRRKTIKSKLLLFNISCVVAVVFLNLNKAGIANHSFLYSTLISFAVGFIVSSFFYLIVVYLPDLRRNKLVRTYILERKAYISEALNKKTIAINSDSKSISFEDRDDLFRLMIAFEDISREELIDLELLLLNYKEFLSVDANTSIIQLLAVSRRLLFTLSNLSQNISSHSKRHEATKYSNSFFDACKQFLSICDGDFLN